MLARLFLGVLGLILSQVALANGEFDGGSPEFDQKPLPNYSEAEIQRKIRNEMAVACSANLCKVVGTDNKGDSWTVAFNVGYGNQNNNNNGNGGDNIYIGGDGNNDEPGYNASITIQYKKYRCESTLKVTPAVYRFVNTYLYNMVNEDGSTKRNFTPADQVVVMFYTTMLSKVENCKAN
ncbi:MAG: protease [Pseudobdellovibrionaceae bacterium]